MKFTRFIVCLLLEGHKIVQTSSSFINFSSVIFWAQNVVIPSFLILPPSATFCNFLPTFVLLSQNFANFSHLLSIFITFYLFLPTFTAFRQIFNPYHFLPTFLLLSPTFTTFYHRSPTFIIFHLFLTTFTLLLPPLTNFVILMLLFKIVADKIYHHL